MKVVFRINYKSKWGENIELIGSIEKLGNWNTELSFPMTYTEKGEWEATFDLDDNEIFEYKYILKNNEKKVIWEGGKNRVFDLNIDHQIEVRDYWRPQVDTETALFSKVFSDVLMKHNPNKPIKKNSFPNRSILFRISAPRVTPGKSIGIIGNCKPLGNWDTPIKLKFEKFPFWVVNINTAKIKFPIEYKYVIIDDKSNKIEIVETGDQRSIPKLNINNENILHVQNDEKLCYPGTNWRGTGVAVPVFSLRSNEGFGVGEFLDLKKLVDWCKLTGQKMIQVLPINETIATHSWLDSYPYKAISVIALHPIYVNLERLGVLENEKLQDEFELAKEMLNSKPYVDYVEVTKFKSRYYKLIFDQTWNEINQSKEYKLFFDKNKKWLEPYAAFCFLRDRYKTSNFNEWGSWSKFKLENIQKLVNPRAKYHEHIAIHYFIQFHLDKQLSEVVEYAHQNNVALKGDIPIGISPNSIEAWTEPDLFNLNGQAGAPPDDFAVLGQNWGFPTYKWNIMANDEYSWWKKRLTQMSKYFDAYRIDHILGFFRIWEIPGNAIHGLLGHFKPAIPLLTDELIDQGIWMDEERYVKPYIRGHFLHELFGEYTSEVRKLYLTEKEFNIFEIKKEYDTQRKIFNHFTPGNPDIQKLSEKNVIIREGLMSLLDEVLFIKDTDSSYPAYHPRITFHNTYSFRELDHETKIKLDQLYIDYFYKRHEEFWKAEALKKLPSIINASNMLVCGEDLGMVPDSVQYVMKELNILSLEIQRMPKNPTIEFGHPDHAPYLSVCTTSTHDMSTIRGWWEENRDKTQRFFHFILGHNNKAPIYAEPWLCKEIINQHLHSQAMWTIFPIQDLIAMDGDLRWDETDKERINVPSNEKNKWRYRMILPIEDLINANEFNQLIKSMINISVRDKDK